MKKILFVISFAAVMFPVVISAQLMKISYAEGDVDLIRADGKRVYADIGMTLKTGESIITGSDGYAELVQEKVRTVRISSGTVFTIREIEQQGQKKEVFATAMGNVKYKFQQAVGAEPLIATPSSVCGVRGTEFEVFAGEDGSTLVIVTDGLVDVAAGGSSVSLSVNEGVEVGLGVAPGAKMKELSGKVDFSKWNDGRLAAMLENPAAAAKKLEEKLDEYIKEVQKYQKQFKELDLETQKGLEIVKELKETKGQEEAQKYYSEILIPIMNNTSFTYLNFRYYILSAISLKRHLLSRIYVYVKSEDFNGSLTADFNSTYRNFLLKYEKDILASADERDI
jgi:hypothetical protein